MRARRPAKRRALAALVSAIGLHCLPPLHSVDGKPCDGQHCCASGYDCRANVCVSASMPLPPNLLTNGGFEDGLTGWMPTVSNALLTVENQVTRGGCNALRVDSPCVATSNCAYGVSSAPGEVGPLSQTQLYCAEAWVTSTDQQVNPRLQIRFLRSDGDAGTSDPGAIGSWIDGGVGGGVWRRIATAYPPPLTSTAEARVEVFIRPNEGTGFFLDDVRLWFQGDGGCEPGP